MGRDEEEELLRSVALQNASSILAARRRAEEELLAAKEALRASEERLRATFHHAAVGIALSDLDGRLTEVNRKFAEIMACPAAELVGKTFFEYTHPEDVEQTRKHVEALRSGAVKDYVHEKRYLRKDGSVVWSRTAAALLRDAEGRPRQFIGVVEDITQRKLAEDALREETRILEILNQTGARIGSELDLHGAVQAVTDAATELSGAKFGAFFYNVINDQGEAFLLYALSGAPREAFERFGIPRNTPVFNPTFRGEGVVRSRDITKDPRYGTMAPHRGMPKGHLPVKSYLAVPVVSRSKEVIGGLFFGHPQPGVFTERAERLVLGVAAQAAIAIDNARLYEAAQKARAEAERMSELKDQFLATLSHELRTPLGAILGWSQVIRSRKMSEEELRRALEVIERNARAQTQLIEDLLDMSRITSGQARLEVQPLEAASFVEAALETVRPAAEAKGIRLRTRLEAGAGRIYGDPGRLQQVAWNLLSNAIKFTPKGGDVEVLLRRTDSMVELRVSDTGMGIEPGFLPQLFDRFRQADASITRRHGGLGIGLAIARHLVELHGGSLRAESAGAERGATFTVQLPVSAVPLDTVKAPDGARPLPSRAAVANVDLSGLSVLAVDDQADARELIKRVLEDCGARVRTAGTALEALALLEHELPQVLVSDIGMPDIDGYELLRRLRALGSGRGGDIPAIALTAFARAEDRARALQAGFQLHVPKPVEPAELATSVARVADRYQIRKSSSS